MASAAEQLAANLSWGSFAKAKELKQRLLFTLFVLIVYRVGTYIPLPGVDLEALARLVEQQQAGVAGVINVFTGGALARMAIFTLGIMPYISASIIMQLLTTMVPRLEELKKEGEIGRKKINQFTRYGTVVLATAQAYAIALGLQSGGLAPDTSFFVVSAVITLVGGTVVLMWLGEQITARGVGNGISLIIFIGIIAEMPAALANFFSTQESQGNALIVVGVILMAVAVIAFVVFVERAQRRILIEYPQRNVGNRVYQGNRSHLPLKVNTAGVIPPIFASSLLLLPTTLAGGGLTPGAAAPTASGDLGWLDIIASYLGRGSPAFLLVFVALIVFFCFFYTAIVFNPEEVSENLKKHGGFVPGIRPGKRTAEYLDYVLTRLTVVGAIYLAFVCILPELLISNLGVPFYFGGTSLLIVVSVTIDTITQVQSHLMSHQYEKLVRKSKIRGKART